MIKEYVLGAGLAAYIDGTVCCFDDGEFAAMLELMQMGPTEELGAFALRNGEVLAAYLDIYDLAELMFGKELYGDYVLKGVPSPGEESMNITIMGAAGIAETCEEKEIAWDVICAMLDTSDGNFDFSVCRETVLEDLEKAVLPADDPDSTLAHWGYSVDGVDLTGTPLTQEEAEYILTCIETATPQMVDADLKAIVQEECEAFFAGDKAAEAVAEIIQNRVMIYLSERS